MSQVQLKVCGITSFADARVAIECGAQYLGFNFYRPSPRYIAPLAARRIIEQLPRTVISVGVFVNETGPADVLGILQTSGAQWAQLHGDEAPDYCAQVGAERVVKALRVGPEFQPRDVLRYPAAAVLLDAYDKDLYGGTGKTANWEMARQAAKLAKIFLAGGLSPENVVAAVRAVAPFAVDVNSGVETAPGQKDVTKLHELKKELAALR
jgi:phosphoribosylanthranilate isomerase